MNNTSIYRINIALDFCPGVLSTGVLDHFLIIYRVHLSLHSLLNKLLYSQTTLKVVFEYLGYPWVANAYFIEFRIFVSVTYYTYSNIRYYTHVEYINILTPILL